MRAKLFRNGRSQAVRLPASCRFEGQEVDAHRNPETGVVTLSPVRSSPLAWLRQRALVLDAPCEGADQSFEPLFAHLDQVAPPQHRGWP
jgi:antitoxin VapB